MLLKRAVSAVESEALALSKAIGRFVGAEVGGAEATQLIDELNKVKELERLFPAECSSFPKARLQSTLDQCSEKSLQVFENICREVAGGLRLVSTTEVHKIANSLAFVSRMTDFYARNCIKPERLKVTVESLTASMRDFINVLRSQKEKALEEMDIEKLSDLLYKLQHFDDGSDLLQQIHRFHGIAKRAPEYKESTESVKQLLVGIREEVVGKGVVNEKTTKSEAKRIAFFEGVQRSIDVLQKSGRVCIEHLGIDMKTDLLQPCACKIDEDLVKLSKSVITTMREESLKQAALLHADKRLKHKV